MGAVVYVLGTLTSLCCAVLLFRGYHRAKRKLLFWSALCFAGLMVSNFLVFVDLVIYPDVNMYPWRLATAAAAMFLLLYGLIWESE
jgi:hypothetical protein